MPYLGVGDVKPSPVFLHHSPPKITAWGAPLVEEFPFILLKSAGYCWSVNVKIRTYSRTFPALHACPESVLGPYILALNPVRENQLSLSVMPSP